MRYSLPLFVLTTLSSFATVASATTYNVTTSADSGIGSLRAALNSANATPSTDSVIIAASVTDIALGSVISMSPASSSTLSIISNAPQGTTIHAGANSQILSIAEGVHSLSINNVKFTGGAPTAAMGGALDRSGNDTAAITVLTNCVFDNNQALSGGAIDIDGSISIVGCTFTNNHATRTNADPAVARGAGGAIHQGEYSALTIRDSSFTDNSATGAGGAIFAEGGASAGTITDSLFAHNSVPAGVQHDPSGGGAIFFDDALTLRNVTVFANTTASNFGDFNSAIFASDSLTMNNVTIAGNTSTTSSVYTLGGSPTVSNSIIIGDTQSCIGGLESNGHNILSTTCAINTANASDRSYPATDPKLAAALASTTPTQTLPLLASSPAIDTADPLLCETHDQRHVARPQGAGCDVGAFEVIAPTDVSIKKTSSANPIEGEAITYTLVISNAGPIDATGVTVTDSLPPSLTGCSVQSGSCTITSDVVSCTLASLGANVSTSVIIACTAGPAGTLINSASVTHGEPDSNTDNDSSTDTTTVSVPPAPTCPTPGACVCPTGPVTPADNPLVKSCVSALQNAVYTGQGLANKSHGCSQSEPAWWFLALAAVCLPRRRRR